MRLSSLLLHPSAKHQHCGLLGLPIMFLIRTPLVDFDPLYHARCVAPSPDGGICGRWIGNTERTFAHTELSLSGQEPNPARRRIGFRNTARLMICDNHKNRSEKVRTVARLWEKEAAQQPTATMHSLANTESSSYNQNQNPHIAGEAELKALRAAQLSSHIGFEARTRPARLLEQASSSSRIDRLSAFHRLYLTGP